MLAGLCSTAAALLHERDSRPALPGLAFLRQPCRLPVGPQASVESLPQVPAAHQVSKPVLPGRALLPGPLTQRTELKGAAGG
jgi:hypothetical protein